MITNIVNQNELRVYQLKVEHATEEYKRWQLEIQRLHDEYAEKHPWNAYKGRKVRVKNLINGEYSEWGYMCWVESSDERVGCIVCNKILSNGSEGAHVFRVYYPQNAAEIEVE